MKFGYFKFPLTTPSEFFGSYILKPIIPVLLTIGTKKVGYAALIDSGADFCIFDAEIGEQLGLDVRNGRKEVFGGIQERGGAEAYFHEVTLAVGGYEYRITAGFSYDIAKNGFGILGQKGFFDLFTVKFDYQKEIVELKEKTAQTK